MRPGAMSKRASGVHIRPARPDEREDLEALQSRASLANENDRPHLEANPDAIHLPIEQIEAGHVTVAESGGRIVGFAAVLVEEATHEARRRGLALMVVANPHALDFYRRCGFSVEGETQTRFGPGL